MFLPIASHPCGGSGRLLAAAGLLALTLGWSPAAAEEAQVDAFPATVATPRAIEATPAPTRRLHTAHPRRKPAAPMAPSKTHKRWAPLALIDCPLTPHLQAKSYYRPRMLGQQQTPSYAHVNATTLNLCTKPC